MKKNLSIYKMNFNKIVLTLLTALLSSVTMSYGQTLYVSSIKGDDQAPGTNASPLKTLDEAVLKANKFAGNQNVKIILCSGLYTVSHKLMINTAAKSTNSSFTIEALNMPDDKNWTPADLPVIMSVSGDNSTDQFPHCELLLIGQDNVTIRGIKFTGNPNNTVRNYYPIRRQDKTLNGLNVTQCYFIGEANSSPIQSSFWVSGPGIHVDHCIFHNSKIAFVLGSDVNDFSLSRSIIDGAYNTAIWYGFAKTTAKFTFENNVVTNCNYVMVYPAEDGQPSYTFRDSYLTGNSHYLGHYPKAQDRFITEPNHRIREVNVRKKGLVKFVEVADDGITKDNLEERIYKTGFHTKAAVQGK